MDYIKVALVITPQFIAGCLLYLLLLKRAEVGLVELLSIGGVLGIISSTIIDQIFVNLQLPRIGWLVSISIIVVAFELCRRRKTIVFATVLWRSEFTKSILPIFAISAMALGTEWFWLFPTGVLFVIAAFFSVSPPRKYSRSAIRVANLAAIAAGIFMIANRPKIWFFMYEDDYPFFQSLSRSLADWGLSDYVLLSGTTTRYHWFTYAWIGLIDRTSEASTFLVLTKVAPTVFALLITGIVWSLIHKYSKSKLRTFLSTFVVMTASSYPIWGYGTKIIFLVSPSQFFATAILFASIFLILESSQKYLRFELVVISVVTASTMLSKTMHGVILISALTFTVGVQLASKSITPKLKTSSGLLGAAVALSTYFLLIANSEGEAVFEIRFADYFWQLQGDARLLPEKYIDLFGFLTITSFVLLPALLTAFCFYRIKKQGIKIIHLLILGALLSGSLLSLLILGASGENLYFLQAAISLSTLLGFALISDRNLPHLSVQTWALLILTGIALCLLSFLIPSINSGAQDAIIIRSMRIYTSSLILIIFTVSILTINTIRRHSSFNHLVKLIIVASSMSIAFSAYNWANTMPRKHSEFARNGEAYFATPSLKQTTSWLNQNSNENDIVGSNFGWPQMISNEIEFFRAPCSAFRNKEVTVETCRRSTNALLTAELHRRTWLQTTFFHYTGFTPEIDSRQAATLGFAADPTSAQLQQMLDDGVDWFVIDRSTTGRTSWEPFATMRFKNESFFVLELNKG